jgi:hypothetical protein
MTLRQKLTTGVCAIGILGLLGMRDSASSYAPSTHREIGRTAVDRSDLDSILKAQYGVDLGARLVVNGETIQTWVEIGAAREDVPAIRSLNHFHSPLRPWVGAGGILGQSSIYWQQNPAQGLGGTWSWPIARQRLFEFLTLSAPAAREQALADTARALGQVMHMIQDAASPAHTREDPHLIRDGYEARTEELRRSNDTTLRSRFQAFLDTPSTVPSSSVFSVTGDSRAPVPVARLIDSDRFAGTVPSYSVGADAGLAEYTSGGYVSDDTIFVSGFALPRRESLGAPAFDPPADTPGARRYFPKTADGDAIGHFVAEGALYERLAFRGQLVGGFVLDDKVYDDYAARLIPRAVAYSAGLLNYFFRSNFDFTVDVSPGDPSKRLLTVAIPPDLAAETMDGTFALYVEDKDGVRRAVAGAAITTPLFRGGFAQAVFAPVSGVRAYVLVFQGLLGDEPGAVTGKVKPTGPVVAALQATAEFTGEELRTTVTEVDDASTLALLERRSKDERRQRARGSFFSSADDAGQHLKRVSLEFDPLVVGTPAVRLLLDDVDVGVTWTRGAANVESPSLWEVRVDLPVFFGSGSLVPNVPRFLVVETLGGIKIRTPLIWWRSVSSLNETRGLRQSVTPCPPELQCEQVISSGTVLQGLVFFGDGNREGRDVTAAGLRQPLSAAHTAVGFVPTGAVAGYGVGTAEQTGSLNCFAGCVAAASCASSTISIFAESRPEGAMWIKDEFSVSLGTLSGVHKPSNACTRPVVGQPAAPDLPLLTFRRDYLPAEQSRFQEFDVIPPAHEITLR